MYAITSQMNNSLVHCSGIDTDGNFNKYEGKAPQSVNENVDNLLTGSRSTYIKEFSLQAQAAHYDDNVPHLSKNSKFYKFTPEYKEEQRLLKNRKKIDKGT